MFPYLPLSSADLWEGGAPAPPSWPTPARLHMEPVPVGDTGSPGSSRQVPPTLNLLPGWKGTVGKTRQGGGTHPFPPPLLSLAQPNAPHSPARVGQDLLWGSSYPLGQQWVGKEGNGRGKDVLLSRERKGRRWILTYFWDLSSPWLLFMQHGPKGSATISLYPFWIRLCFLRPLLWNTLSPNVMHASIEHYCAIIFALKEFCWFFCGFFLKKGQF